MICLDTPHLIGLVLMASMALAGCRQAPVQPEFGAPYELVSSGSPGGPDTPPRIHGGRLLATISYTGGCTDHDFELDYAVRADTTHLWVVHEDGGDTCEALLLDDLMLELPFAVSGSSLIALHPPDDGQPYIVRWRSPP